MLAALLTSNPTRFPYLYQVFAQQLIDRFKSEREENVKIDLFETFGLMIKSSVDRSDQFTRAKGAAGQPRVRSVMVQILSSRYQAYQRD